MFSQKDLDCVDNKYFRILGYNSFCITLQSKNTLHYWHMISQEYGKIRTIEIFHRHRDTGEYHSHGHASTVRKAINSIQSHDQFQLTVRRRR